MLPDDDAEFLAYKLANMNMQQFLNRMNREIQPKAGDYWPQIAGLMSWCVEVISVDGGKPFVGNLENNIKIIDWMPNLTQV